ncbi:MAG: glycosyltransferase family 2 protein [Candidatus Omnitrophica bacterium]|nr:glycosyltransferase family 2 protein [Candidatus Omnitrophota bacterium]
MMANQRQVDVSIIIPAYNEEKRLGPTLIAVADYFLSSSKTFEIIVVDDGSTDGTAQLVEKIKPAYSAGSERGIFRLVRHETNQGKGKAVRTGVLLATGRWILFTDADLSTPITEFDKMEQALRNGDEVVIGSRALPESRIMVAQPWFRRQIGRIFPLLVRCLLLPDFHDTQCGFKAFKKETAQRLFQQLQTSGFAFDVEILLRAKKAGINVREIPVIWYNSRESKVSLWRSPWQMLAEVIRIRKIRR